MRKSRSRHRSRHSNRGRGSNGSSGRSRSTGRKRSWRREQSRSRCGGWGEEWRGGRRGSRNWGWRCKRSRSEHRRWYRCRSRCKCRSRCTSRRRLQCETLQLCCGQMHHFQLGCKLRRQREATLDGSNEAQGSAEVRPVEHHQRSSRTLGDQVPYVAEDSSVQSGRREEADGRRGIDKSGRAGVPLEQSLVEEVLLLPLLLLLLLLLLRQNWRCCKRVGPAARGLKHCFRRNHGTVEVVVKHSHTLVQRQGSTGTPARISHSPKNMHRQVFSSEKGRCGSDPRFGDSHRELSINDNYKGRTTTNDNDGYGRQ